MTQTTNRQRPAWFRPGSPNLNMRVSDAERAEVADRLARHYSDGRLDRAEFDERVSRAMAARTFGELQGLFDDLPDLPGAPSDAASDAASSDAPGAGQAPWMPPMPAGCGAMQRRGHRGLGRLLLTVALVIVAVNITTTIAWHAMTFAFAPVTWIAILVVVILLLSNRRH